MWKERKGDKATYNNLIKIFEGAGNQQCADFIRHIGKSLASSHMHAYYMQALALSISQFCMEH